MYTQWYGEARQRFSEQPNPALAMPFFNRLRTHVLKLALVHQVSQSLGLRVSSEAMERAIEAACSSEEAIFALLPTGMSREGFEVDRMAERIKQAGPEGLLRSELTRGFQHVRASDRYSRLHTLVEAGMVIRFGRGTAGRRAEVLVHRDHTDEHGRQFTEDEPW